AAQAFSLGRTAGSSADDFHDAAEIDWNVSVHMRSSEKLAITAPLQGRWRFEEAACNVAIPRCGLLGLSGSRPIWNTRSSVRAFRSGPIWDAARRSWTVSASAQP